MLGNESASRQFGNQGVIHRGAVGVIETFQCFVADHLRFSQTLGELALVAAGHFVLHQQRQEVGVSQLSFDGLTVSGVERIEDTGQA